VTAILAAISLSRPGVDDRIGPRTLRALDLEAWHGNALVGSRGFVAVPPSIPQVERRSNRGQDDTDQIGSRRHIAQ
jgi:hypothetical protein